MVFSRYIATRGFLAALTMVGIAALPQAAHAQVLINFDLFGSALGDEYGPGAAVFGTGTSIWNLYSRGLAASSLALLDDTGAASGVTVDYARISSGGTSHTGTFASLGVSGAVTDVVTFNGLTPNGAYDLVIFSGVGGTPSFTVGGTTKTISFTSDWSTLTEGQQYVSFQTTADGTGSLSFTSGARWSGFQLRSSVSTPSSVTPELPGAMQLLPALLPVALIGARKRFKKA